MTENNLTLIYEPEFVQAISKIQTRPTATMNEFITALRDTYSDLTPDHVLLTLEKQGIRCTDTSINASPDWPMKLTILSLTAPTSISPRPGIVWYHGGGAVSGNRFGGLRYVTDLVRIFGATVISAEYRLAPEYPAPIPQDDCFEALAWTARSLKELNIDSKKLMVGGSSAGAGLAAGVVLRARDEGKIAICGQLLINPMLDDRNETESSRRCTDDRIWGRASNIWAWKALLGEGNETGDVSQYIAPARAKDLSSLPPTFITVGAEEPFADEARAYSERIRDCSGSVEIHVWPKAYHAFESVAPEAKMTILAGQVRRQWVARTFDFHAHLEDNHQFTAADGNFLA